MTPVTELVPALCDKRSVLFIVDEKESVCDEKPSIFYCDGSNTDFSLKIKILQKD